jgi:hypothetical protein
MKNKEKCESVYMETLEPRDIVIYDGQKYVYLGGNEYLDPRNDRVIEIDEEVEFRYRPFGENNDR